MNLLFTQLFCVATLPIVVVLFWFLPGVVYLVYFVIFTFATLLATRLLNGRRTAECLVGLPENEPPVNDEEELWFFINGVATGYGHMKLCHFVEHHLTIILERTGSRAT
jgi:hypothetical protein